MMYSFDEMLFSVAVAMYIAVSMCIGAINWDNSSSTEASATPPNAPGYDGWMG